MARLNINKLHILKLLLVGSLTACSTTNELPNNTVASEENICISKSGMLVTCGDISPKIATPLESELITTEVNEFIADTHTLESSTNSVMVGDYVEQISTDLLENMAVPVSNASVGITSFVEFSTTLSTINLFGTMLAEEFIFELQRNGIEVVDYKVQDSIEVRGTGDFIFSRNTKNLNLSPEMKYVLVGTLMYNKQGIWVNARMVDIESKKVISTAKRLVPYFVLDNIIPFSTDNLDFTSVN